MVHLAILVVLLSSSPAQEPTGATPGAEAWKILEKGAADSNSLKRVRAIAALGTIGLSPRVVKLVEGSLADKDSLVRQTAAATLGEMRSRGSIPLLQKALDDKTPVVCFAAAKALWDMGDRSGRDLLSRILSRAQAGAQGAVGANMADAKRRMHDPGNLALTGIKEGASFFGPFGLGIGLVEELAKDRSAPARALSATLLGADQDSRATTSLEAALADKNTGVRVAAARALGQRGDREAIAKLQPLLKDSKDSVRFTAAASIVRLSAH